MAEQIIPDNELTFQNRQPVSAEARTEAGAGSGAEVVADAAPIVSGEGVDRGVPVALSGELAVKVAQVMPVEGGQVSHEEGDEEGGNGGSPQEEMGSLEEFTAQQVARASDIHTDPHELHRLTRTSDDPKVLEALADNSSIDAVTFDILAASSNPRVIINLARRQVMNEPRCMAFWKRVHSFNDVSDQCDLAAQIASRTGNPQLLGTIASFLNLSDVRKINNGSLFLALKAVRENPAASEEAIALCTRGGQVLGCRVARFSPLREPLKNRLKPMQCGEVDDSRRV